MIYTATNRRNDKVYVGYTEMTLDEVKKHLLRRSKYDPGKFMEVLNKRGLARFKFEVVSEDGDLGEKSDHIQTLRNQGMVLYNEIGIGNGKVLFYMVEYDMVNNTACGDWKLHTLNELIRMGVSRRGLENLYKIADKHDVMYWTDNNDVDYEISLKEDNRIKPQPVTKDPNVVTKKRKKKKSKKLL